MKTELWSFARSAGKMAAILLVTLTTSAFGDTYWGGVVSTDWADPSNWGGPGIFPTNAGAGNAIINPAANPCVVSNAGNYTVDGLYVSIGVGLTIMPGGQLTIPTTFVTGVWGNSLPVNITGGELNVGGYINIGPGGFDGDVNISDGTVTAGNVAINSTGGAKMDISGSGKFITGVGGNAQYYVAHNNITANGNAVGWSVNMYTNTTSGKLELTAVYVPPATSTNYVFDNGGGDNLWATPANWNPDGKPGELDTTLVDGSRFVLVNAGTEPKVGKLSVGSSAGEGAVNFNAGCSVSFRDTNISVIVGGVSQRGSYPSYCTFNGGTVGTLGDLIIGGNDGWADARHYGGSVQVGGTFRLGSYQYTSSSPTNASLRLIGSTGGLGAAAIEIGGAGTVSYEFNGGAAVKTLIAGGAVTLLAGAVLVVDGTGYSGASTEFTLLQGASLSGTFTTAILTNFPSGVTATLNYTTTRLKLSVVASKPNMGLVITAVGGGTNRISWNMGDLLAASNLTGPWLPQPCAIAPIFEAASASQKFYRCVLTGTAYQWDNEAGPTTPFWSIASNWNPDGSPGASDEVVIANGKGVYVDSQGVTVRSIIVGKTTGSGALNMYGGSLTITNPCASVIIGGPTDTQNSNYYRHPNGDLTTVGDFIMGSNGSTVDAQHAGPGSLTIGGTLRLGSYQNSGNAFFELLGTDGTVTAGGFEVGSAGELIFNFNGGSALKTLNVSGAVSLLTGSKLTLKGGTGGFPSTSGTYDYVLIQGGSRTGTFTTVNSSGFPAGATVTAGYSGGNVTLHVVVP